MVEVVPASKADRRHLDEVLDRFAEQTPGVRLKVMITSDDGITPAAAGRLLGVSRQFVDRLVEAGQLPVTRLPHSTHRRIPVAALDRFLRDRHERGTAFDDAVRCLDEVDGQYE